MICLDDPIILSTYFVQSIVLLWHGVHEDKSQGTYSVEGGEIKRKMFRTKEIEIVSKFQPSKGGEAMKETKYHLKR